MNDVTDILDRLRARKKVAPAYSGSVIRSSGPNTPPISVSQPNPYPTTLVNPDGEEAAKLIEAARAEAEALRGEVERLRAYVEDVAKQWLPGEPEPFDDFDPCLKDGYRIIVEHARAALASEPGK